MRTLTITITPMRSGWDIGIDGVRRVVSGVSATHALDAIRAAAEQVLDEMAEELSADEPDEPDYELESDRYSGCSYPGVGGDYVR